MGQILHAAMAAAYPRREAEAEKADASLPPQKPGAPAECGADEKRDPALTWVEVDHDLLGSLSVGVIYDAEIPARWPSAYGYASGERGDPGMPALCEVHDVRDGTLADRSLFRLLSDQALEELADLALDELAKEVEQ